MSINIIEQLSNQQGIETLPKIDPNTQNITGEKQYGATNLLLQAAIPSILAGFYQHSRKEENGDQILQATEKQDWLDILFGTDKTALLAKIASYASVSPTEAASKMEEIADNTVSLLKNNVSPRTGAGIKNLFTAERHNILQHLPGAIDLGKAINDTTFDDRTNKMEGPVSSLMHAIEKQFTSTDVSDPKK